MSLKPAELTIVTYPDAALRTQADPIVEITDEVRHVADRMIELMHEAEGVGLAAPQVGLGWRMFVTAGNTENNVPDRVYINPRLADFAPEFEIAEEGCLSLPNITADIRRPVGVTITATDLENNPFTLTSQEWIARVWQHEFDHLDGVLILDKMKPVDRIANRKAVKQLKAAGSSR